MYVCAAIMDWAWLMAVLCATRGELEAFLSVYAKPFKHEFLVQLSLSLSLSLSSYLRGGSL